MGADSEHATEQPQARVNVAQASWRLGYHIHDHRRVGATGAVVLMEPPNGQVTGHWAVCSAVSSCMVVGPCTVHVLSESTHLPLALPGAHAGSVMVSLNLESRVLVKHKMGPAFSHFGRLRRGLSFCFCRVPPCIFVPCTWRFSDPPDPGMSFAPGAYPRALAFMRRRQTTWVRDGPCRGTQNPGKFPEYSRCILE